MNDERPIEKLLRRAAKKRGDESGPAPELHPANRRLLQAEVARQFPKPVAATPSPLTAWWTLLKQRWVYGVGIFAAIWIVALILSPLFSKPKSKELLAENTAREIGALLEAKKSRSAQAQPVAASGAGQGIDRTAFGYDESAKPSTLAAEPAVMAAPPVATAPQLKPRDQEVPGRRELRHDTFGLADAAAKNNQSAATNQTESKPKARVTTATAESLYQPAPASVAQRARPDSNNVRLGSAGASNGASTAKPSGLKQDSGTYAAGALKKEFAAPAVASLVADSTATIAPVEAAVETRLDKSWVARGGAERTPTTRSSQAYSNLAAEKLARKKDANSLRVSPNVLVNFRVEQAGRDLRVVDGDGSVYTGVVDEENTLYKQQMSRQNLNLSNAYQQQFRFQTPKLTTAPATAKVQAENYFSYRVEGTNRTLNQNVVFTWNFIDTNALASGNLNYNAAAQKLDATKQPSQFPELLQKSLINGRAQFGPEREVEVNALPVKR